jgi:hypothetical protein
MSLIYDTERATGVLIKPQRPSLYQVLLRQKPDVSPNGLVRFFPAATRTLRSVFKMDYTASHIHAAEAARTGKSSLLQTTWDVAQTKASEATERFNGLALLNPRVLEDELKFVIEPAT